MTEVPKRLSFLSYAVNGGGVGHLVRQVAIQRWLKRFCAFAGSKSEHWFLTTSEADSLCFHEGFCAFKLPSKTIVDDAGLDKLAYIAMAKQWVWNSLTLLRPDVLVVDTFPNGSFHELGNALDVVAKKVLVLRPVKQPFAQAYGQAGGSSSGPLNGASSGLSSGVQRGAFQSLVRLYDRVVVPEHEDDEPSLREELGLPPSRVAFCGPVVRSDRFDAYAVDVARARLGIPAGKRAVLVTGGGGGDASVEVFFDDVTRALAGLDVHIVYAAGPLFRGRPRHRPGATFFTGHDLAEHLAAFASEPHGGAAVCAAGFNTIHELLFAGVPTLVIPQRKIADDQLARAQRYADRQALRLTSTATLPADLRALLADDEEASGARAALSTAARAQMPDNHAKDAAREILSLVLPPSLLRAANDGLSEAWVAALQQRGESIADVVDLALSLQGKNDRAAVDVDAALALVTSTETPAASVARVVEQLKKKARVDDVAGLCAALLTAPSVAGQHHGLVALLGALQPERGLDGRLLVEAIVRAADAAAGDGRDLLSLARGLPFAGADVDGAGGNSLNLARLRVRPSTSVSSSSPSSSSSSTESGTA